MKKRRNFNFESNSQLRHFPRKQTIASLHGSVFKLLIIYPEKDVIELVLTINSPLLRQSTARWIWFVMANERFWLSLHEKKAGKRNYRIALEKTKKKSFQEWKLRKMSLRHQKCDLRPSNHEEINWFKLNKWLRLNKVNIPFKIKNLRLWGAHRGANS